MYLRESINEFQDSEVYQALKQASAPGHKAVKIAVPEFAPIGCDKIEEHLDQYAPEWKNNFNEFANQLVTSKGRLQGH